MLFNYLLCKVNIYSLISFNLLFKELYPSILKDNLYV